MAKRRKKSNKRERIPVIDFLLDMAQAATLDYIAYKRRQKRGNKRTKIDPYEATGMAVGMDLIDDTEDLIRFGGMLGAMGAFDPDEPDEVYQSGYAGSHDSNPFYAPKNNKYAWRLNCEDGSEYGISPENYETRDEYHDALEEAKEEIDFFVDGDDEVETGFPLSEDADTELYDIDAIVTSPSEAFVSSATEADVLKDEYEDDDFHVFIYCKVETTQGTDYYRTENTLIKKGDTVSVPMNGQTMVGKVLSVERHMRFSVPKPVGETWPLLSKREDKEITHEQ